MARCGEERAVFAAQLQELLVSKKAQQPSLNTYEPSPAEDDSYGNVRLAHVSVSKEAIAAEFTADALVFVVGSVAWLSAPRWYLDLHPSVCRAMAQRHPSEQAPRDWALPVLPNWLLG